MQNFGVVELFVSVDIVCETQEKLWGRWIEVILQTCKQDLTYGPHLGLLHPMVSLKSVASNGSYGIPHCLDPLQLLINLHL